MHAAPIMMLRLFYALLTCCLMLHPAKRLLAADGNAGIHIIVGTQWGSYRPDLHYAAMNTAAQQIEVSEPCRNSFHDPALYMNLNKLLTNDSFLDLIYTHDSFSTRALSKQNVRLWMFMIPTIATVPVDINIQTLRFLYSHALWRQGGLEVGGSGGIYAAWLKAQGSVPLFGYTEEDYFALFPATGLYSYLKISRAFTGKIRANYLPLSILNVQGQILDVHCGVEYGISRSFFAGIGYRYSQNTLQLDDDYYLDARYAVKGVVFYIGLAI